MNTSTSSIDPDFSTSAYSPSRTGKIARLPRNIRDELNTRIEEGASAVRLAKWLNGLKEVRKILAEHFHSRDINEQNLSDWKHGGYRDWQRQRALREQIRLIAEQAGDLESLNTPNARKTILDSLATLLAAELAVATQTLLADTTDPKHRWLYLRQSMKQLQQLRRGNYIAARARMELERWELESAGLRREEEKASRRAQADARQSQAMAPIRQAYNRAAMVRRFGGGEAAEQFADQYYQDIGQPEMMRPPTPDAAEPATPEPDLSPVAPPPPAAVAKGDQAKSS